MNGKISSSCCYQLNGVVNRPSIWNSSFTGKGTTAEEFVNILLQETNTAISCIIDVGFNNEVGWSVIRTEPVWSADIYGCNASKFVDALFTCARPLIK